MIHRIELDKAALPFRKTVLPVIQIASLGLLLVEFVNGEYIGNDFPCSLDRNFISNIQGLG